MNQPLRHGRRDRFTSETLEGCSEEEPGAAARRGGRGEAQEGGRHAIGPPDCDPPPPGDPLGQHLYAGAEPAGRPPEDVLLELLARSRRPLQALLKRLGVRPEDSQDFVQHGMLIVVQHWREIRNPRGYLLGTVEKLVLMHWRRVQGESEVLYALCQAAAAAGGEIPQGAIERQLEVRRLLAGLPEATRRILELRYGGELSWREVAGALGGSAAGVRQTASRAMRRLRQDAAAAVTKL